MAKPERVAIVTGVGSGLGLELASRFAAKGCHVVGVSRREPSSRRWAEVKESGKVRHVTGDVSVDVTVEKAFSAASGLGDLLYVVNCAGAGVFGPVGSYQRADLDDVLRGNLIGTVLFSEAGFNKMKTSGGSIINVMSTAAHVIRANESIYCASKWGARAYTESLRLEAKGTPVRILAVYPGGMNTPFWKAARGADVDESRFMSAQAVAEMVMRVVDDSDSAYVSDIIVNRK